MPEEPSSILSHVSIGTNDFERATDFYDTVLGTLGIGRFMEHPGAVAYGRAFPEFWVQTPIDGEPGPRPIYGAPYYGCFLRDPDGHKIEAMVWEEDLQDAG